MKVAVATIDGVTMSQHFGRSAGFVVFDLDGKNVKSKEVRTNDRTPHAQGLCHGKHEHGAAEHGSHSHVGVVELLGDCDVVLCGGMGAGAAQALSLQGIQPVIVTAVNTTDEALTEYLNGKGLSAASGFCNCKH